MKNMFTLLPITLAPFPPLERWEGPHILPLTLVDQGGALPAAYGGPEQPLAKWAP